MDSSSLLSGVYAAFVGVHAVSGLGALILFWVPVVARKGGVNHRRIGAWYVKLMWSVVITASVLCVVGFVRGNTYVAFFLCFLALITARPLWLGITVLKSKRDTTRFSIMVDRITSGAVVAAGLLLIVVGIMAGGKGMASVMIIFGVLGLSTLPELLTSFKPARDVNWMQEHIAGMCATGIAAHTAFLVFGAGQLVREIFTNHWAIVPWVLPAVVGIIGTRVAVRKYAKPQQTFSISRSTDSRTPAMTK